MARKLSSKWHGGALLGQDGWCLCSSIEAALARKQYGWFEHFAPGQLYDTTHYPGFTVTAITATSAGTLVMADAVGGVLNLTGGTHDGSGIQMQSDGEIYIPAANKDIYYEMSVTLADADDIDWFVGLASTDTNVFSTDPTDIIAFRGDDGDANIDFQCRKAGTGDKTDTTSDTANSTEVLLGFLVNGVTSVTPFINGTAGTAVTGNIPIVEMALTFGMLNGATTNNNTLGIDWCRIVQVK